jgi:hypothetical protein
MGIVSPIFGGVAMPKSSPTSDYQLNNNNISASSSIFGNNPTLIQPPADRVGQGHSIAYHIYANRARLSISIKENPMPGKIWSHVK